MSTEQITNNVGENVTTWINAISNQTWEGLLMFAAVIILGIISIRLILKLLDRFLESSKNLNQSIRGIVRLSAKFILIFILVITAAGTIGVPITSFVALFSVLALAVSLAIQGLLSNLAGSLIIVVTKPFKVGDFIDVSGMMGTVTSIGLMHTQLLAPTGFTVYLPNSTLYTSGLTNVTAYGKRRTEIPISASYDNSPAEVEKAAYEVLKMVAADESCGLLDDPAPSVVVDSYGDSAINYLIRIWTLPETWKTAKYTINRELYSAFKRNGVEMTYPHMNVHMQN